MFSKIAINWNHYLSVIPGDKPVEDIKSKKISRNLKLFLFMVATQTVPFPGILVAGFKESKKIKFICLVKTSSKFY